jgi:hypothetical protein
VYLQEDDLSLASEELWVNRTIDHANQAAAMNVSGLLGLIWRTWETAPQITALAQAGWEQANTDISTGKTTVVDAMTDATFYKDFCTANFGAAVAEQCVSLFLSVDGWTVAGDRTSGTKLPRNGQRCCGGPMSAGHVPDSDLLDVSGFETWLSTVTGDANVERATAWVNLFRYHRLTELVSNASAALKSGLASSSNSSLVSDDGAVLIRPRQISSGVDGASPCKPKLAAAKCFVDKNHCNSKVLQNCSILPGTIWIFEHNLTQESCAVECKRRGYRLAGVEYSTACFCGNVMPTVGELPIVKCSVMKCAGDTTEACGDGDVMLVYPFECGPLPPTPVPPPTPALAHKLKDVYSQMITRLLEFTSTPGQMGMVGAHEGANWPTAFGREAIALGIVPNSSYTGAARIYRPAVRTVISMHEPSFLMEAAVLSATPPTAVMLVLDGVSHQMAVVKDQLSGEAHSQVYSVRVPTPAADFEYFVAASFGANGTVLRTPGFSNQTVVVVVVA